MLIRSQSRKELINFNKIETIEISKYKTTDGYIGIRAYIGKNYIVLGEYITEEKAIKVIDMIQEHCLEPSYITDIGCGEFAKYEQIVFQMPEDKEVN